MFVKINFAVLRHTFLYIEFARMGASFLFGLLGSQALQASQEA
jgi:hypothetical protein